MPTSPDPHDAKSRPDGARPDAPRLHLVAPDPRAPHPGAAAPARRNRPAPARPPRRPVAAAEPAPRPRPFTRPALWLAVALLAAFAAISPRPADALTHAAPGGFGHGVAIERFDALDGARGPVLRSDRLGATFAALDGGLTGAGGDLIAEGGTDAFGTSGAALSTRGLGWPYALEIRFDDPVWGFAAVWAAADRTWTASALDDAGAVLGSVDIAPTGPEPLDLALALDPAGVGMSALRLAAEGGWDWAMLDDLRLSGRPYGGSESGPEDGGGPPAPEAFAAAFSTAAASTATAAVPLPGPGLLLLAAVAPWIRRLLSH